MRYIKLIVGLLFFSLVSNAQVKKDTTTVTQADLDNDTVTHVSYTLEEIYVSNRDYFKSAEERKKFLILQRRVHKTYPYAKIAADRLVALNEGMKLLKSERDKKKYFKLVENYLTNEFEDQLKKMSRKDGQILVKLIHRQTGSTTFDLIKELKSGWKAFWSNNTAKLFDINLKTTYDPYNVSEDFIIEGILFRGFSDGKLPKQAPKVEMNYSELAKLWRERIKASKQQ
ncbi:DUF4294 domain-containing protein [Flavobacterium terrae]|uniref:DUF4294 domain-containing protein n=1 Tax=Flavobacterium terrae TaxID=415425 RepID=A0A1M6CHL4_9FLAO|nr:DUF4294 domain-containing protein [Flavobacterium terrae]SHI60487.1 protein of unknown function [Flavobacterium terrae]